MLASVLVYGVDTIAVEMATLLNTYGCKVYIATENRFVLPAEDHDSDQPLEQALCDDDIEIIARMTLTSVKLLKSYRYTSNIFVTFFISVSLDLSVLMTT